MFLKEIPPDFFPLNYIFSGFKKPIGIKILTFESNKPKVAKEDQRSIGSMIYRLDGQ